MATRKVTFDPDKPLKELSTIVEQIEASKDVDRSARQQSKVWKDVAVLFDEAATGLPSTETRQEAAGRAHKASEGLPGLAEASALARKIADVLNPVAEVTWSQDDLQNLLVSVRFFYTNGAYEGEDLETAKALIEKSGTLTRTRVGGTTGEAKVYTDRPEVVTVYSLVGDTPTVITSQNGQTENAAGNLKKSLVDYLKRADIAVTDEMAKAMTEQIGKAVRGGESHVKVGDFAEIRHGAPS